MNKNMFLVFCILAASINCSLCSEDPATIQRLAFDQLIEPWHYGNPNELMEFEFADAELTSLVHYMQEQFNITFLLDDALKPLIKGGKNVFGNKISFKTNEPLTKKDAWALFLKFLDLSGLRIIPGPVERVYRITSIDGANKSVLPTYIGVNPDLLPNDDTYIRYVHFVKDANLTVINSVLDSMKSASSPRIIQMNDLRAFLLTDKSYNIKTMLNVVNELDTVTMPETMSIIKLKKTDAVKVAKLYDDLTKSADGGQDKLTARLGMRTPQTLSYFTPGTRVIPEPRSNTLIILGTEEAVRRFEDFIVHQIDKDIEKPYAPIHVYELKHTKATSVATILSNVVKFQSGSEAAKSGSIRDGTKYFKPLSIIPEESGNRLIITADYEDYLKIHEVLEKIDVEQPQVAMRVLVVEVDLTDTKALGTQIRNKKPGADGLLGPNVNFQTSGLAGSSIVQNTNTGSTGATNLLGNLVNIATGGIVGSTFMTLGSDCYGVWGLLRVLETYTHTNVISSPFLITANNFAAKITIGETRRIQASTVISAAGVSEPTFADLAANLEVFLTPQISYEGFITLNILVKENNFTTSATTNLIEAGNRTEREIKTEVILANNEVVALGGLIRDTFTDSESKVPILGDIPIVGWLFKNKTKIKTRSSILVLISPEILPANDSLLVNKITSSAIRDAESAILANDSRAKQIDPIHRWFFRDNFSDGEKMINQFVDNEQRFLVPSQKESLGNKKRLSEYL